MIAFSKIQFKSYLSDVKMWLFFATVNLALWYCVLANRIQGIDPLIAAFFWLLALFLLWKKRDEIAVSPQPFASIIGLFLLGWVLYRGIFAFWFENRFVQLLPLIGFFAIALIPSGWKGLKLYLRPFLAIAIISLVNSLVHYLFSSQLGGFISQLTAQVSGFFLHYVGFDVSIENIYIYLANSSVQVGYHCTGGYLINLLFQLTIALRLVVPLSWQLLSKFLLSLVGMGFFLGVIRVAILALVASEKSTFDYWHGNEGNQIFSLIAFSIWIVSVHFVYEIYEKNQDNPQSSSSEEATTKANNRTKDQNYNLVEEKSITTFSLSSPRSWLLPLTGIIVAGVTLATMIIPAIGRREVQPLQFPSQLNLPGWKATNTSPLVSNPEREPHFNRFRSGQQYYYQKQNTLVKVELRFVTPSTGKIKHYIEQTYNQSLKQTYQQGNTRYISDLGHYQLFNDEEKAYLNACLNPTFESTARREQYNNKTNRNVLNLQTFIPRLLGQQSFRERRCLWVNLSTPLDKDSPEKSYRVLEEVFKQGYPKWQQLFH